MRVTDLELVERVQNGDTDAYGELVRRYQDRVYSHVTRMTGQTSDDAADVTQEIFLKAYTSLNQFRGQASFQTWLYRIASNLCIDRHRRRQRGLKVVRSTDQPLETDEGSIETEVPDWERNPERSALSQELQGQVQAAIGQLSDKLRAVVVMYDLDGLSYEEIATALNIPVGTVKSRLFHARAALKDLLTPYLAAAPGATVSDLGPRGAREGGR